MKKNSQLHVFLETQLMERVRLESEKQGISISEFGRIAVKEKLQLSNGGKTQLDRIENLIKKLEADFAKRSGKIRSS